MDMATHAIDCDLDEDCTCGEDDPVYLQVGMNVAVIPLWAYETLCELGVDPQLAQIQGPLEHSEHGPLEI